MKRLVLVCAVLVLAAACRDGEPGGSVPDAGRDVAPGAVGSPPTPSPTATPNASSAIDPETASSPAVAPSSAATPSSGARSVAEETDDFVFDYAYPAKAGDLPDLAALLDRRLERRRTALARQASRGRQQARANGFPYNKYSSGTDWKVVADLPGWLSLSGEQTSYTGGAHGNYGVEALVWNKRTGEATDAITLFISPKALGDALGQRYCDKLDAVRAERRAEPITGEDYGFNDCPPVSDLTVLVGSSNKRTFNRLTLYAGPYVAGPYAEGAYEVDLDIDKAVLEAVKPAYRESFSARR